MKNKSRLHNGRVAEKTRRFRDFYQRQEGKSSTSAGRKEREKTSGVVSQGAEAVIIKKDNNVIKDRIKKSYRIKELDEKLRKQRTRSETKLLIKASKIINCPAPLIEKMSASQKDELLINKKTSANTSEQQIKGGRLGSRGGSEHKIIMPFIKGKKLSEHLDKFPLAKQKQICKLVGQSIAKLHDTDIIHGDLTTSNMILVEKLPAHSRSQIDKKTNNKKLKTSEFDSSLTSFEQGGRAISRRTNQTHQFQAKSGVGGIATDLSNPRTKSERVYFIDFGLGFISNKIEDKAVDIHLLKQALEAKHFKHWQILWKEIERGYLWAGGERLREGWKKTGRAESGVRGMGGRISQPQKILERLKSVEKRGRYKH